MHQKTGTRGSGATPLGGPGSRLTTINSDFTPNSPARIDREIMAELGMMGGNIGSSAMASGGGLNLKLQTTQRRGGQNVQYTTKERT